MVCDSSFVRTQVVRLHMTSDNVALSVPLGPRSCYATLRAVSSRVGEREGWIALELEARSEQVDAASYGDHYKEALGDNIPDN